MGRGIELNRLAELPVIDFRFSDPSDSTLTMKRAMDVSVSALMLALLSPLLVVASILILIDSGRPVLFRQLRAGKDGVPFTMLKFRTMVADAEERLAELVDLSKSSRSRSSRSRTIRGSPGPGGCCDGPASTSCRS